MWHSGISFLNLEIDESHVENQNQLNFFKKEEEESMHALKAF